LRVSRFCRKSQRCGPENAHEFTPCHRPSGNRNAERRPKTDADYGRDAHKYLTPSQVESLIKASSKRDGLMISLAYHHGLRVSELISLEWSAIGLKAGTIVIRRAKGGIGGTQQLARHDRQGLARSP
jgi:integrase